MKELEDTQAIVRCNTPFGLFDYFLVEAIKENGIYKLKTKNIDIDKWIDTIKKVTGYCNHGTSFRDWWKSINSFKKVAV